MFWKRVIVGDQTRILVVKNGRFDSILGPGTHRVPSAPMQKLEFETYQVRDLVFESNWTDFLVRERPEIVARYFTFVETGDEQVAMLSAAGKLYMVLGPGKRLLFWREAEVIAEIVNVREEPQVPADRLPVLERLGADSLTFVEAVNESAVGLLFLDNRLVRTLGPGKYGFWAVNGSARVEEVDLRRKSLEVTGQEILTKDKVSIRVNILADYQVEDPVKAKQSVRDFSEHFYRTLQLAMRQALGKRTLEEILADKTDVDEATAEAVRVEMAAIGVRAGTIAIKDIILPGEMKDILNQVVAAEKQAQANLIRRREETAATRSLLNTAKLMEDNPILVRLKELETLEKVVEKVGRLTVNSGLEGLLDQLVTIRGPKQ